MPYRTKIINRLKSLVDIDGVSVEISDVEKTLTIRNETQQSLDFYFKWIDNNHWVGYFEDKECIRSHAVIALWLPMDAVKFAASYSLMIELKAGRPNPL